MVFHSGHCRCGGVKIEVSAKPTFSGLCHCDDCRRSNGAPFIAFAGFNTKKIRWVSNATIAEWRNGNFGRHFCKQCGSPVAYSDDQLPETLFFYTGFMENPDAFPPKDHSYYSEKISWLELDDNLERHQKTSYPRPE